MPKLSDAIRAARRGGGRRIGFGPSKSSTASATRGLLVVTTDRIDPNAAAAILSDDLTDAAALQSRLSDRTEQDDAPLGLEPSELTADRIQTAEQAGADFVVLRTDHATADALLSTKLEYVLRLSDGTAASLSEIDLRALASLRPALIIAPPVHDPLPVADLLRLRKLGMFIGAPLAVAVEPTATAGLLEALRESGVAVLLLTDAADSADVTALQTTVQSLPARSRRRDDDRDVIVPGIAPADDADDDFEDD